MINPFRRRMERKLLEAQIFGARDLMRIICMAVDKVESDPEYADKKIPVSRMKDILEPAAGEYEMFLRKYAQMAQNN